MQKITRQPRPNLARKCNLICLVNVVLYVMPYFFCNFSSLKPALITCKFYKLSLISLEIRTVNKASDCLIPNFGTVKVILSDEDQFLNIIVSVYFNFRYHIFKTNLVTATFLHFV